MRGTWNPSTCRPIRRHAGRPFTGVLLALVLAACAPAGTEADPPGVEPLRPGPSLTVRARELNRLLARGELPGGIDRCVRDLRDVAVREQAGTRATEALQQAGDLLAARYRIGHRPADLQAAGDLYRSVAATAARPAACSALHAWSALLALGPDRAAAQSAHRAWEERCVPPPLRAAAQGDEGPPRVVAMAGVSHVRRVVLDPGHGGSDPGAIGPTGLTESAVNLAVARRVAERLATQYGVSVVLTRDRDAYVDLEERAAHANAAGADLFVSIHCNSSSNTAAHGISTFVLDTTSERVAARVGGREGDLVADDPVSAPDLARILADLRLSSQGVRSLALAGQIQAAMLQDARFFFPDVEDMGVHPASFHVLVTARMPSVLVELSFVSNVTDEQRLRSEAYRDLLAGAIARAIAGS